MTAKLRLYIFKTFFIFMVIFWMFLIICLENVRNCKAYL